MPKGILRTIEERRLAITHTAAELIIYRGFNETSVSQIAKATGIGKLTICDFLKNKR